jgi:uncharacterized protein (TIGR03435 family)
MKRDRTAFEKHLARHLSLFGSPSADQLEASRARIRERLRARHEAPMSEATREVRASRVRPVWRVGLLAATATAAIVLAVTSPWQRTDWLATVEAADGSRYSLAPNSVFRSNDAGGTMLTLKDGSRVEMRSQSELSLERAPDGIGIHLRAGSLIVDAAKQNDVPRGLWHLYVQTKDMTVAVTGTLFVVNAEDSGSRVTVIEGEVRVREGTTEKRLRPGEQVSTSPGLAARPMKEEVGWSRHADAILAAFTKGMAETAAPLESPVPKTNAFVAAGGQVQTPGQIQSQTPGPEFETAAIRQCDPDNLPQTPEGGRGGGANSFQLTPGRLRALCMTAATLIRTAYGYGPTDMEFLNEGIPFRNPLDFGNVYGLGVEDGRRVRGGPDWVRSERYTVEAVAGAGITPDARTLRASMLQQLLERRMQLKVHVDQEQVPAFALTAAKGGLKIKPVAAGACDQLPGRAGSPLFFGYPGSVLTPPRKFEDVRRGEKPSCGLWGRRNGPNMVYVGGGVPLAALTQSLGGRLGGVRVLDRTGTSERFNFILEFAIDENTPGPRLAGNRPLPPEDVDPSSDIAPAATIFTALEDQLGLRLERAQTGREFIVIDHVERPTPN